MSSQPALSDHILVVDDSPDNVFLIQTILEEEGYKISTAEDGPSALAEIEQSPPSLVLLDVMMPGMDGFEVTKRIRQDTKLSFIPILLITAHDSPSVAQGLDIGADDFIRKPVEVDELLARVRSLFASQA
jgi:DNA-binding response OmpR family regulator